MSKAHIAIIGAGVGGLTAALALRHAGFSVALFEAAHALGEVGAGLTLSRGSQAVMRQLGLQDRLSSFAAPSVKLPFVHYRTGALLAGTINAAPDSSDAFVPRQCHRADLHALLVGALDIPVHLGHRLVGLETTERGVRIGFANGQSATADAVIGADGVHSVARKLLWGDTPAQFSHQIAYRFLVKQAAAAQFLDHGRGAVFIGPGATFNRYLLRGGSLLNCVGIVASDTWLSDGWQTPASRAEMSHAFNNWHEQVTGLIAIAEQPIKWGLFHHAPLPRWRKGCVTLLGDAAHAMPPFLGMGAAMAIEDGMILARALALEPTIEAGLERYETARRPRTADILSKSVEQGKLTQASNPDVYDHANAPAADRTILDYDPVIAPI